MIQIERLSKRFGRSCVLDAVDLEIPAGERVALIGANGAGKTTLIRILLGEYTYEGSVRVHGRSPRLDREIVLREFGFVPQLPPPLKLTVSRLIDFAAGLCDSEPERMVGVARHLGLDYDGVRSRPIAKLSGGQQQKLLIAVALGRDSRILLMDEPAANLDPEARHAFFGLLAERAGNTSMLISSHRLDEVAPFVERVVELDHGKVVLDERVPNAATAGGG
jgi:ABC-2 type transport system ATP-binding protein